jgi:hypothetical protein
MENSMGSLASRFVGGWIALVFLLLPCNAIPVSAADSNIAIVTVDLSGSGPTSIKAFQVEPVDSGKTNPRFSVHLTRVLTADTSWLRAFENAAVYNMVVIRGFDAAVTPVVTYTLTDVSIASVRHFVSTGSESTAIEEMRLLSSGLSISTP